MELSGKRPEWYFARLVGQSDTGNLPSLQQQHALCMTRMCVRWGHMLYVRSGWSCYCLTDNQLETAITQPSCSTVSHTLLCQWCILLASRNFLVVLQLKYFDIVSNSLTGTLPSEWSRMTHVSKPCSCTIYVAQGCSRCKQHQWALDVGVYMWCRHMHCLALHCVQLIMHTSC